MYKYVKIIVGISFFVLFFILLSYFKQHFFYDKVYLYSGDKKIKLYVADNLYKIKKGLSIFKNISYNEGMIFYFSNEGIYGFWMKNMKFDIDLIWINKNKEIIGFIKNFKKESFPKIYYPPNKIKYVIELKNGSIDKFNFKIGEKIIVQSK